MFINIYIYKIYYLMSTKIIINKLKILHHILIFMRKIGQIRVYLYLNLKIEKHLKYSAYHILYELK